MIEPGQAEAVNTAVQVVTVVAIAVFAAAGVFFTFVKPDKKWHRWVGFAFVTALVSVPVLTGMGVL